MRDRERARPDAVSPAAPWLHLLAQCPSSSEAGHPLRGARQASGPRSTEARSWQAPQAGRAWHAHHWSVSSKVATADRPRAARRPSAQEVLPLVSVQAPALPRLAGLGLAMVLALRQPEDLQLALAPPAISASWMRSGRQYLPGDCDDRGTRPPGPPVRDDAPARPARLLLLSVRLPMADAVICRPGTAAPAHNGVGAANAVRGRYRDERTGLPMSGSNRRRRAHAPSLNSGAASTARQESARRPPCPGYGGFRSPVRRRSYTACRWCRANEIPR